MRIRQEVVLGVGGVRALLALDLRPRVFHMNEGHCAFLGLERVRHLMHEHGLTFREALEIVAASGVFTTHTPVPAGIDVFNADQMERYFGAYREIFGVSRDEFLDLGRVHPRNRAEPFNMAVLAIRTATVVNGVSRLHAKVSRAMWRDVWPGVPDDEIPISHITNGVHAQSWISDDMRTLYDRYLGPRWAEQAGRHQRVAPERADARRGAVAHARAAPRAPGGLRPAAARQPVARARRGPDRDRGGRRGARSRGADHRVRAPVCRPTSAARCC